MTNFDENDLRRALGNFATGICLVTTLKDHMPLAITINSFSSVSLDPPLVLWSIQNELSICDAFVNCDRFCINVLSELQVGLSDIYSQEGKNNLDLDHIDNNNPEMLLIKDALVQFTCKNDRTISCGDHTIIIGRLDEIYFDDQASRPLLFHRGSYASLDDSS